MAKRQNNDKRNGEVNIKGFLVMSILIIIAVVFVVMNLFSKTEDIPSGLLSNKQGTTTLSYDKQKLQFFYTFEDIPYAVAVPSKGLTNVEGGYAYVCDGYGLVVAEVTPARTKDSYSTDLYSSLYAINSQPHINKIKEEEGYINEYSTEYGVYEIDLDELQKKVYEFIYLMKIGRENIVIVITTEDNHAESFEKARDLLNEIAKTVIPYESSGSITEEKEYDPTEVDSSDKKADSSDDLIMRQAVITAAQDYKKLCLVFSYIDISSKPEECYVMDKNDKKYNAFFMEPGSYGFMIPNVSEGDDITIYIESNKLNGTTIEQCEYDEYLLRKNDSEIGTLHVEDDINESKTDEEQLQTNEEAEDL